MSNGETNARNVHNPRYRARITPSQHEGYASEEESLEIKQFLLHIDNNRIFRRKRNVLARADTVE